MFVSDSERDFHPFLSVHRFDKKKTLFEYVFFLSNFYSEKNKNIKNPQSEHIQTDHSHRMNEIDFFFKNLPLNAKKGAKKNANK